MNLLQWNNENRGNCRIGCFHDLDMEGVEKFSPNTVVLVNSSVPVKTVFDKGYNCINMTKDLFREENIETYKAKIILICNNLTFGDKVAFVGSYAGILKIVGDVVNEMFGDFEALYYLLEMVNNEDR